jgi:hypothetical protein
MYRYIYKITCTAGFFKGKFYFGKHTTEILDDGYKGSGKKLRNYYKKHPNDYIKEIICFCDSEEELNKAEYEIIHPCLGNKMCLNLCEGGHGGARLYTSDETCQKLSKSRKEWWDSLTIFEKNKIRQNMSIANKGHIPWMKGKHHSEESKKKQSESRNQYLKNGGTSWNKGKICKNISDLQQDSKYMTDEVIQIRLKPEYWGEYIDIGFIFGTLQKYNKNNV